MRVHLIKEKTIREFVLRHAHGKPGFDGWLSKLFLADWNSPDDINLHLGLLI